MLKVPRGNVADGPGTFGGRGKGLGVPGKAFFIMLVEIADFLAVTDENLGVLAQASV
jgi:hypothetical protein